MLLSIEKEKFVMPLDSGTGNNEFTSYLRLKKCDLDVMEIFWTKMKFGLKPQ